MSVSIHHFPVNTSSGVPRCRIYLWGQDDRIPVADFIKELKKSRPEAFNRLGVLLQKMVELGRITNAEQFKDVEGHKPLFEFKPHGVRIYCSYDGADKLILVEGDIKKTDKSTSQNKQAIARAEERVSLYLQEKKAGRIEEK